MRLQMPPHVFHRVEFGCIRWQTFYPDATTQAGQIVADQRATMNAGTIPEDQQLARELALEMLQELDHLWSFDASRMDLEVEPQECQAPNDREALPIKSFLEQRRLPDRGPRSHPGGASAQPAFIDKDDEPALAVRFFFIAGHCTRFHCRMPRSLRSTARRSGR